jgi:hypothetical protein
MLSLNNQSTVLVGNSEEPHATESSRLVSRSMAHKELLEVGSPCWPRSDRGHARILDLDLDRDAADPEIATGGSLPWGV